MLLCYDNDLLEIYHLESKCCLRTLKHRAKVLDASLHNNIIVAACQYGYLVFWDLQAVLKASEPVLDIDFAIEVLNEHSAAIASVYVDDKELISVDYDGVMIFRSLKSNHKLKHIYKRKYFN